MQQNEAGVRWMLSKFCVAAVAADDSTAVAAVTLCFPLPMHTYRTQSSKSTPTRNKPLQPHLAPIRRQLYMNSHCSFFQKPKVHREPPNPPQWCQAQKFTMSYCEQHANQSKATHAHAILPTYTYCQISCSYANGRLN